jgi:hypothetical protein
VDPGSTIDATNATRRVVSTIVHNLGLKNMIDAGSGPFYWM